MRYLVVGTLDEGASMPGMMDTILNLGLNEDVVKVLSEKSGNPRWAWDSYRRFIQMYSDCQECLLGEKYVNFEEYLNHTVCGEGMVGENNYLLLWEKNEIEELNDDYETQAFLNNIILIGSDGGDMAYGIDISGKYIEVPFIGMDDEEVKVIAEDFDGFIDYVWNRK